ncbi:MAG: N-6 DNA methylase [Armatimonadota bacterium]|nr:N-6 DNA methylase [Armatimonadota bacterium]
MATTRFEQAFTTYLTNILDARAQGRHHDHRRQLFTAFLQQAFDVDVAELELEERVTGLRVRGFIDLLYQYLVFEFKRDLDQERADGLRELSTYLQAVARRRPLGVLTDGVRFEVYLLEDGRLQLIDEEDLEAVADNPVGAYLWFEAYLFSARDVLPTPEDIVRRFGARSPVFVAARASLRAMFADAKSNPAVHVKYTEWDRLLAKVYGQSVGADDLFVRHTYLTLLARVIAYVATQGRRPRASDLLGVVDGSAFRNLATNLAESDFFAWVLAAETVGRARDLLAALVAHMGRYDLTRLGEMDILQRLYQDLIDPADRHDLGEYYTPDWLAELTLREANYEPNKSLLDLSCGSGTFLFTAIRLLAESGLDPHDVTRWALDNIVGVDVHPVAVLTSKVNYVLALQRFGGLSTYTGVVSIPVYMADSLISPESRTGLVPIAVSPTESFHITEDMALLPAFDTIVDEMSRYAALSHIEREQADSGFREWLSRQGLTRCFTFWGHNLRLMRQLIAEGRDSIWAFILKNAYRPVYLSRRKFDFVVGNPPWLSYRYVRDAGYRQGIRNLVFAYGLLERSERQLFTQIELATLFYTHARRRYLADDGTIAFVMPRSVITGALQHRRFRQAEPLSKILDLKDINIPSEPSLKVFGVDSCVLIGGRDACRSEIPMARFVGTLPAKGLSYEAALSYMEIEGSAYRPPAEAPASAYLPRMIQGATIVPRGLWFARPATDGVNPRQPFLITDPAVMERAKEAWRHVHIESEVEADFLYATLLSNDLVPFGSRAYSLVVLPLHKRSHQARHTVITSASAFASGYPGLGRWLTQAEQAWEQGRSAATQMTLNERLDYQRTLTDQDPVAPFRILFNNAGTHICAAVIDLSDGLPTCHGLEVRGFLAESKTYWTACETAAECHYLAAVLNAPCVDNAITPHQTRGAYHGARDIGRRPFQVLSTPIPLYDHDSAAHQQLVALSMECHESVASETLPLDAEIGRLRQRVRSVLAPRIAEIDEIVRELLGLVGE